VFVTAWIITPQTTLLDCSSLFEQGKTINLVQPRLNETSWSNEQGCKSVFVTAWIITSQTTLLDCSSLFEQGKTIRL